MKDAFRKYDLDGSGKKAMPLSVVDKIQIKPVSGAKSFGIYLARKPRVMTG